MDYTYILAILVVVGVVCFGIFMKNKNFGFYNEVKLGLLVAGVSFKEAKIKEIADTAMEIVKELETLDIASTDKHTEAVKLASTAILRDLGLKLDKNILDLLVDVAVAFMPQNQK